MDLDTRFEASYQRVIGEGVGLTELGRNFFERFYENFFGTSEEIRAKFANTDMSKQVQILQKSMYHMVSFYLLKTESAFLRGIALTHNQDHLQIEPHLYDIWLDSLLLTVEQMDPEFEPETRLAWTLAMMPGIVYLKFYYSRPIPAEFE